MDQQVQPQVAGPRRGAKIVVRVLGGIAVVATAWLIFMGGVLVGEWPTYVGHESSTALAIFQVVAVVPTAIAWAVFLIVFFAVRRGSRAG
ncbi:hypothetical protein OEB99_03055 [Actinotalea sp. M2MS4P-6]|uniref:hypothetical protein n=1 Tax=Actinotalea sp. M2MS4P-6 TaxID=2983762 RepID=UPI0021E4CAB2|nr:hypothetical protein [Actinotalea sp. M2MS4P-6]MCV2393276.1 hypothetical protein [Actinotalea sp. M2MS4P-6]